MQDVSFHNFPKLEYTLCSKTKATTYLYVIQLDYTATLKVTQYDNDTSNDNGYAGYTTRSKIMIIMIMGVFAMSLLFFYCDQGTVGLLQSHNNKYQPFDGVMLEEIIYLCL